MIRILWEKILALFGKNNSNNSSVQQINEKFNNNYETTEDINFTAIFANKLANNTISDSNIDIVGDNKRAELLKKTLKKLKKKLKKVVSRGLGTGGVLVVPYVTNNDIYFNIVNQSRFKINKSYGEDIFDCTILAEWKKRNNKNYYRWADYTIENGNLYIRYKATEGIDGDIVPLNVIAEWATIEDISITNVKRMPFMYLKSPTDNRRENDSYGVPITYGCDEQIKRVKETIRQIDREYNLKEVFIGADSTMFKDSQGIKGLPEDGIYKKINAGDDTFWEIFDPEFRDTPLFNKLMHYCALLEKAVGTSAGVLTKVETSNATATEIKKEMKDTFDLCDDIRDSLEDCLKDFLYACDVLANYYHLSPPGDYQLSTDWSYELLEDTDKEFSHLMQGHSKNVIKDEELRQFIKPHETIEESKKVVDEIRKEKPTVKDLVGE